MFYVYILRSLKDGKMYIGQTNNIEARLERHNKGDVKSTRNRRPLELIYTEKYETRTESMNREKYLKSLKGGITIKKILEK